MISPLTKICSKSKVSLRTKDKLNLNPEQATLLDKKFKSFSRNGALLSEDKKHVYEKLMLN